MDPDLWYRLISGDDDLSPLKNENNMSLLKTDLGKDLQAYDAQSYSQIKPFKYFHTFRNEYTKQRSLNQHWLMQNSQSVSVHNVK